MVKYISKFSSYGVISGADTKGVGAMGAEAPP